MWTNIFWLVAGLIMILYGANLLTDGSSAVARRLGVSDLVIGLTVVAFGTSAPELVISIVSAINGSASLAVGNVVGSNIFNILAIIGITALIRPMVIRKSVMTNEIPMVILSSVILLVMGYSAMLDGSVTDIVTRVDGIFLLIFFLLYLRYTFASARHSASPDPAEAKAEGAPMPTLKAVIFIILGLAGLIFGGDKFVDGASGLASAMGISEAVIGLTIVAVGTSLPELATSIVAATKDKPGLAIGNVIGSNIFNVLFVLGSAAVVRPLPFGGVTKVDLWVLMAASFAFMIFGWYFRKRLITRAEGALMALGYIAYTVWLVVNA